MPDTPPPRGFPNTEYEARLVRAHEAMGAARLDALLLTTEADIRYLSGFQTQFWQSPTRPWYLVVPKGAKPIAVIPQIGETCMARGWIEDIRTWSSPHPTDDGVSLLCATLKECTGRGGTVGAPLARETHLRMPVQAIDALRKALNFADASPVMRKLRMVKSEHEIAKIAHVCSLVSDAFD